MQNRFRSKTAWLAIIALVVFILKTYFNISIPEADKLIDLILIAGTAFGVFNNPTNKEGF